MKQLFKNCGYCGKDFVFQNKWHPYKFCSHKCFTDNKKGIKFSEKHKQKISEARLGISPWNKGMKGYNAGSKHSNWKGGITPINTRIRNSYEMRLWKESIFKRDNYICMDCGQKGGQLEADHIKPFAYFPELRFELSNGRTLCIDCHKKTDTYKGRATRFNRQLQWA